nr:MAG: hypothetical protein 2 [Leviviridae sp.]
MSLTLKDNADANVTYTQVRSSATSNGVKTTYSGPAHTDIAKDSLVVTTQDPKRTSDSYGNRRTSIAYYKTIDVDAPNGVTGVMKDLKVEVSVSLPVGATASELNEAAARVQAFLASETYLDTSAFSGGVNA